MGIDVQVVPATEGHALELGELLRPEDYAEGLALGLEPRDGLRRSVLASEEAYAVLFDGEVAYLFGVVPHPGTALASSDWGIVWMLSGRACSAHPKEFLRSSRWLMEEMLRRYRFLHNLIDARYEGAIRWAQWLGAEVGEARPYGPNGMLFRPFIARRAA